MTNLTNSDNTRILDKVYGYPEDVLAGRLVSEGSTLRVLVNKALGEPVDAE